MPESETKNIPDELVSLEHKMDTLEGLMRIAQSMERLQDSLQSVLLLGKSASRIPKSILKTFESLSEKTLTLPTNKLQATLANLDKIIKLKLNTIMSLTSSESNQDPRSNVFQVASLGEVDAEDRIHKLVNEFKRTAQTAVALRVLLKERGVFSKPIDISKNNELINTQLNNLKQQQQSYRKKITNGIKELQNDAAIIFKNTKMPIESRKVAKQMFDFLQKDLLHIKAGKRIEDMPMAVEIFECGEDTEVVLEEEQDKKEEEKLEKTPQTKKGRAKKLWHWLTTPTDVSWDDIK